MVQYTAFTRMDFDTRTIPRSHSLDVAWPYLVVQPLFYVPSGAEQSPVCVWGVDEDAIGSIPEFRAYFLSDYLAIEVREQKKFKYLQDQGRRECTDHTPLAVARARYDDLAGVYASMRENWSI